MIPELKGREILTLLERHIWITMHITIGTRNLQKYVSRTSVVFVSISFIVLMIISLAWLVFYYIQRFRYANARDRNQVRLRSGRDRPRPRLLPASCCRPPRGSVSSPSLGFSVKPQCAAWAGWTQPWQPSSTVSQSNVQVLWRPMTTAVCVVSLHSYDFAPSPLFIIPLPWVSPAH